VSTEIQEEGVVPNSAWTSVETHYNYFRDYDPQTGRYIESDPTELHSVPNTYAYVSNSPIGNTDPWGLAPGDDYPSADAAASDAIRDINPTSIEQHLEYAGRVYKKWFGFGAYTYSLPRQGKKASSDPGSCPVTGSNRGVYHTHGGNDPGYDNENFSPADKAFSDDDKQPIYLGTPNGLIKKYIPVPVSPLNGLVTTIGSGAL
jgi:RHS repeat-associated protein